MSVSGYAEQAAQRATITSFMPPDKIGKAGQRSQKAGIMPGDFFSQGVAQLHLFDENAPRAESEKLMAVLDHLNAKGA